MKKVDQLAGFCTIELGWSVKHQTRCKLPWILSCLLHVVSLSLTSLNMSVIYVFFCICGRIIYLPKVL